MDFTYIDSIYGLNTTLWLESFFWTTSSLCIALALHCIFTTILLQVLGPGLALSGPIGSVMKAAIGMHIETQQVFVSFVAMAIMFAFSTACSFWIIMDPTAATVCSAIFFFSTFFWWYYCLRIYNKFHYELDPTNDFNDEKLRENESSRSNSVDGNNNNSMLKYTVSIDKEVKLKGVGSMKDVFKLLTKRKERKKEPIQDQEGDSVVKSQQIIHGESFNKDIIMDGYLVKRGEDEVKKSKWGGKNTKQANVWVRRYFVLTSIGHIKYYKNRTFFKTDPIANAIKDRPIEVYLYNVNIIHQGGEVGESIDISNSASVISKENQGDSPSRIPDEASIISTVRSPFNGKAEVFEFQLKPLDKNELNEWSFRADTREEFDLWVESLMRTSKLRNQTFLPILERELAIE
jgi:hypothetical protein